MGRISSLSERALVPYTDVSATARLYLADQRAGLGSDVKLSAIELKDVITGNVPGAHMSRHLVSQCLGVLAQSGHAWPRCCIGLTECGRWVGTVQRHLGNERYSDGG